MRYSMEVKTDQSCSSKQCINCRCVDFDILNKYVPYTILLQCKKQFVSNLLLIELRELSNQPYSDNNSSQRDNIKYNIQYSMQIFGRFTRLVLTLQFHVNCDI